MPGRKQIHSYVQDVDGIWWKTVDFTVTEVINPLENNNSVSLTNRKISEEIVLTDPSGLHMRAGPYLLLYSRFLPQDQIKEPLPWPEPYVVRESRTGGLIPTK